MEQEQGSIIYSLTQHTDIETPQESKYNHIIKDLLKDNYQVIHDYDAQSIIDAFELGDMSMLCDIVGDRDIAELI